MKTVLKNTLAPILAGTFVAFVTMMIFESVNSLFFPFPEGMDTQSIEALRGFIVANSPQIFWLVLCGWFLGALFGGYVTARMTKEQAYKKSAIIGLITFSLGVLNAIMLWHPWWVNVFGLPLFIVGTYAGFRLAKK